MSTPTVAVIGDHNAVLPSHSADDGEIEIVELADHPFFLGTLFQPQVAEHDASLHPLIVGFWRAVVAYHQKRAP